MSAAPKIFSYPQERWPITPSFAIAYFAASQNSVAIGVEADSSPAVHDKPDL
jgi:hypothetical protein